VTERKPTLFEIKFGKLSVQIQRGDITRETTDAIAMLSNSRLDFQNQGAAWNAIIMAAGKVITMRRSVNHKLPIPHGQTVIVPAGDLMVRKLIICAASDSKKSSKISENLVACLKAAEEQEFNSVSFPAVGTGNLGLSHKECANVMFLAAKKFSKTNPRSVQQIRIIVFQESMMNDFISAMRTCSAQANKKTNSFWKFIKKNISFLKKADKKGKKVYIEDLEMSLHLYSGSPGNLNAAVIAINDIMNEKSVLQKIKKEVISCLEEAQMNEINSLEQQFDCKVTIEQHNCLITVAGLSEDVLQASAVIHDILHKIVEAKHERTKAESVAKDVQWQYETDDVFTSYTVEANAKIETAFVNKEESVTFVDNGEEFTIAFDNMIEISSTAEGVSSHTNVKRKDLRLGKFMPYIPNICSTFCENKIYFLKF
jgi:O-acetyl-ADP-ribose deacetylase (regulator of RNase III)